MSSTQSHTHFARTVRLFIGMALLTPMVLLSPSHVTAAGGKQQPGKTYVLPEEFDLRLKKQKAKTGEVQISLGWNNRNDLDLHVICPSGQEIFYGRRFSTCKGRLDVDMNVVYNNASNRPIENVFWPDGQAPAGKYRIYVNHYRNHGRIDTRDPTYFTVRLLVQGKVKQLNGYVVYSNPTLRKVFVGEFEVEPTKVVNQNPQPKPNVKDELPKTLFRVRGSLNAKSEKTAGKRFNSYKGRLNAGETYQIDLVSTSYDTYLQIQLNGKVVAADDNSGNGTDSRLLFTPTTTGTYEIMAGSNNPDAEGSFNLNLDRVK